jgi:hypothetical protein
MPPLPGGPIDWEAWTREAMAPRGNKGRKMSPEICAKFSAAQKARFARQRAALAEAAKRQPPPPPAPDRTVTVYETILGSMEPGRWYSTRDMRDVSGERYGSCKALAPRWYAEGILRRAQNPAWAPVKPGQRQEPKWLYCLTPEGEKRHRAAAALL